jgi:cellulose synthase operon protein YhjQ
MSLICFASPKGGVGKTFVAANVAGMLGRAGRRIIALDLDPQNALRLHFGIKLADQAGYTHDVDRLADWQRQLVPTASGVSLLPYGPTTDAAAIEAARRITADPDLLAAPLRSLTADRDVTVIVDTPPGPNPHLAALIPLADLVIVILQPNAASIATLPGIEAGASYSLLDLPDAARDMRPAVAYIVNQYDPRTRLEPRIVAALADHLGDRLVGIVYRDENVAEAIAAQRLLADYAPTSKAAADLALVTEGLVRRLHRPVAPMALAL